MHLTEFQISQLFVSLISSLQLQDAINIRFISCLLFFDHAVTQDHQAPIVQEAVKSHPAFRESPNVCPCFSLVKNFRVQSEPAALCITLKYRPKSDCASLMRRINAFEIAKRRYVDNIIRPLEWGKNGILMMK